MAKTVATPLERAINGVPGMTYMTTVCTNDGMSLTTVYFKVGTDPDVAAVNVQNRATTVLDELPKEGNPCRCGDRERSEQYVDVLECVQYRYHAYGEVCAYNFADINVLRELKRIDGVGLVEIMGSRDYAMRVWLNPARMAAYNLVPQDVTDVIVGITLRQLPERQVSVPINCLSSYSTYYSTPESSVPPKSMGKLCSRLCPTVRCCV